MIRKITDVDLLNDLLEIDPNVFMYINHDVMTMDMVKKYACKYTYLLGYISPKLFTNELVAYCKDNNVEMTAAYKIFINLPKDVKIYLLSTFPYTIRYFKSDGYTYRKDELTHDEIIAAITSDIDVINWLPIYMFEDSEYIVSELKRNYKYMSDATSYRKDLRMYLCKRFPELLKYEYRFKEEEFTSYELAHIVKNNCQALRYITQRRELSINVKYEKCIQSDGSLLEFVPWYYQTYDVINTALFGSNGSHSNCEYIANPIKRVFFRRRIADVNKYIDSPDSSDSPV